MAKPEAEARAFLLPPAPTSTGVLLGEAAARRGLITQVPVGRRIPPELLGRAHLYGGEVFADEVAARLGLALLEPPLAWLAELPYEFVGRQVGFMPLDQARALDGPAFVKPAGGKAFPARVYASGALLPDRPAGETPVLVSEPVDFAAEYRLHLLDGEIRAASRYAVFGRIDPAPLRSLPECDDIERFVADLVGAVRGSLPSAVVVDVGTLATGGPAGGPAVIEANEAWFSSCYAADPDGVLDVVLRSAQPRGDLDAADLPFVRKRDCGEGAGPG